MKKKILLTGLLIVFVTCVKAQDAAHNENLNFLTKITQLIIDDNVEEFSPLINKENLNFCDGNYSLLSQTVRFNARRCFDFLIKRGVNVNRVCAGYVPPLMHAAKYGRLEMVKVLVKKGANLNFKYEGSYRPANGHTAITYAESNNHPEISEYLKSVKNNP